MRISGYPLVLGIAYCLLNDVIAVYQTRHESSEESKDTFDPVPLIQIDKGLIDLDETGFDIALDHYPEQLEKNGEDMRETRVDGVDTREIRVDGGDTREIRVDGGDTREIRVDGGNTREIRVDGGDTRDIRIDVDELDNIEDQINIELNEGDRVTAGHIMSEMQYEVDDNTTIDDEDLASGSGSGDLMIEDATGMYMYTAENDSSDQSNLLKKQPTLLPYCDEHINVTWEAWSPWIQSGTRDIRFRRCHDENTLKTDLDGCKGNYFESRPCIQKETKICRLTDGTVAEQFNMRCHGLDLNDVDKIGALRDPFDRRENCQYTLYDIKYRMAIGNTLTTDELQHADGKLWCFADDKYIPFYTPKQRCLDNLRAFCKMSDICKYEKTEDEQRSKSFIKQTCWKDFVLGGVLPMGIPVYKSQQMICQRFAKESKFGAAFGHTDAYYATLYDTKRRLPLVSMVTVRSLGDEKWPNVPFMIERGLAEEENSNIVSWFFRNKKKGMTSPKELTSQCELPACQFGKKQALPSDFEYSGYKMMPLLPPDLIGWDMGQKVATFTMTNVVPMETTVYSAWKRSLQTVRNFAKDICEIPIELPFEDAANHRRDGHDLPELYLLSGTVSPLNHMEVIGNDVIVPEVVWLSACCAHGKDVSSFGIYTYNQYGQSPTIVSIDNLHVLLQSMYYDNVDQIKIDLYPAFDSLCSAPENDVSVNLVIP